MKSYLLIICILITMLSSCKKEDPFESCDCYMYTEFTFGHFYGECIGEGCVEIFRVDLDQQKLLEDVNDFYPRSDTLYNGNFEIELQDEKFQQVKDLMTFIPASLFAENETILGQPDAGDWGGIYFEIRTHSGRRFWLLDQMKNNVPEAYHQFIDEINERIYYINQ